MITLTINGRSHEVDVPPEMPLLWVVRDVIGMTGTKFGCGIAQCGACTMHLDGVATRTCVFPVSAVGTKKITTIEGLGANGLHALQQAWIDEQVPQCGYCQNGMMIAAVQLLAKNPHPTVAEIKDAFTNTPPSPHLCRCGTYTAIIAAIQRAAKVMAA
jgi:isoquinoline 1-oxidoreductase alpha subunit